MELSAQWRRDPHPGLAPHPSSCWMLCCLGRLARAGRRQPTRVPAEWGRQSGCSATNRLGSLVSEGDKI